MQIKKLLEEKIVAFCKPIFLSIENESHKHASQRKNPTESHFKVIIVSNKFENIKLVARHRLIYQLTDNMFNNDIHALALHTYTELEWNTKQHASLTSPRCHGRNS